MVSIELSEKQHCVMVFVVVLVWKSSSSTVGAGSFAVSQVRGWLQLNMSAVAGVRTATVCNQTC
jgi:hypothetical protein